MADAGKNALDAYQAAVEKDRQIQSLQNRIQAGRGKYADVDALASRSGLHAGRAIVEELLESIGDGDVDSELVMAILRPTMLKNYGNVLDMIDLVQNGINKRAGLGLKAVLPGFNQDRLSGLVEEITSSDDVPSLSRSLVSQIENASMSIVDDAVSDNMDFHFSVGRSPKIIRTAEANCCKWCDELAGVYDYDEVKQGGSDVFRRHENCRCTVEFDPGTSGGRQNVHTKRMVNPAAVERRKSDAARMLAQSEERKQNRLATFAR